MRTRFFLGLTLLSILWVFGGEAPRPALACTTIRGTLDGMIIEGGATVVVGRFVRVDSIQRNGLFEVRQYLAGEGDAQYLTIHEASSELNAAISQGADVGCDSLRSALPLYYDTILFAHRRDDGSYSISSDQYVFPITESTQKVYFRFDEEADEYIIEDLTLEETLGAIAEISGEAPRDPNPDSQRSFLAPLLIVTDQNTAYMLPVDGADPILLAQDFDHYQASGRRIMFVEDDMARLIYLTRPTNSEGEPWSRDTPLINCPQQDCASISSRGIFTANFTPGEVLVFGIYLEYIPGADEPQNYVTTLHIDGPVYGYHFSPRDNLLAVWREKSIEVFSLGFTFVEEPVVTSISIMETSDGLLPEGVWSNDERRIAFTDEDGLWLWNVYADERQLLIEIDDATPIATSFSGHGNYLHVQTGGEAFYIDITTGERHPTGFMSPDERWLAFLPSEDSNFGSVCDLIHDECHDATWPFAEYFWLDDNEAVVWAFGGGIGMPATQHQYNGSPARFDTYNEDCRPVFPLEVYFPDPDEYEELPWYYGIAFDLEPVSQTIVVQNDANTISVGYQLIRWQNTSVRGSDVACNNYVSFDLADRIDGEIVSVEWLPSIFISD